MFSTNTPTEVVWSGQAMVPVASRPQCNVFRAVRMYMRGIPVVYMCVLVWCMQPKKDSCIMWISSAHSFFYKTGLLPYLSAHIVCQSLIPTHNSAPLSPLSPPRLVCTHTYRAYIERGKYCNKPVSWQWLTHERWHIRVLTLSSYLGGGVLDSESISGAVVWFREWDCILLGSLLV